MPVRIRQEMNTYAYDAHMELIRATPQIIQSVVVTHVQPAVQQVVDQDLKPYPPPIAPGVFKRYATPKQLRYVMAKIRRGEWSGRTGALAKAWAVIVTPIPTGAILDTGNLSRISKYVVGRFQQRFHFVTGWPTLQSREFAILGAAVTSFQAGYAESRDKFLRMRLKR